MKLFDRIAKRLGYVSTKRSLAFSGAKVGRLTDDWPLRVLTADAALRTSLRTLRSRSRDLERNNNVARGFRKAVVRNVLGSGGIKLQMKVKNPDGTSDKLANDRIERAWKEWCESKWCDYSRKLSWRQMEEMALTRAAFDGESVVEIVADKENPAGISLAFKEADLLDELYNEARQNTQIVMSVEVDSRNRPVRYWFLNRHPGEDYANVGGGKQRRYDIPASDIVHLYLCERPTQTRGVPWMSSSIIDVKMLDGYKEAELVAARIAASKAGFITSEVPDGMPYAEDESGEKSMEVEPGVIEELPMGKNFVPWDPSHPNQAFGDFIKSIMRGIATGNGMSYTTLSSDLEGVNYSSIRAGLLEEREEWIQLQGWMIQDWHRPIFRRWLQSAILTGFVNLPMSKIDKFMADTWCGRRWAWVDPEKDIRAALMAVDGGLRSRRRIVAESDAGDFEDVLAEIAEDNELAKEAGVTLVGANGPAQPQPVAKSGAEP